VVQAAWSGQGGLPWKVTALTFTAMAVLTGVCTALSAGYHVLGTDQTGNDVLYQALKSVRTAVVIGTLTTLTTLPLAVGLGIAAGYWRGWVDEAVQYLYTVLSSVPNVLLIAACVLMVQVFLDQHPELFETGAARLHRNDGAAAGGAAFVNAPLQGPSLGGPRAVAALHAFLQRNQRRRQHLDLGRNALQLPLLRLPLGNGLSRGAVGAVG
jgi:ABC-type dipeptide/oligopeptide/nickel transport system permease subunit